jgi:hypothetical protein
VVACGYVRHRDAPESLAALAPEAVLQRADAVVERIIEQLMTAH